MTVVLVDVEQAVRTWARTEAHISAVNKDRVFFATPPAYDRSPQPSWITLMLVSESETPDDLGLQHALVQLDCWGSSKATAASVALAVQTAGRQLREGPPVTVGQTVFASGDWQDRRWLPDPTTNTPRYVVDLLLDVYGVAA